MLDFSFLFLTYKIYIKMVKITDLYPELINIIINKCNLTSFLTRVVLQFVSKKFNLAAKRSRIYPIKIKPGFKLSPVLESPKYLFPYFIYSCNLKLINWAFKNKCSTYFGGFVDRPPYLTLEVIDWLGKHKFAYHKVFIC